jgi:hypothetical protein
MISCRKAAELISRESDARIPLHWQALLRFHLLSCGACRRFRQQLVIMRLALSKLFDDSGNPPGSEPALPPASKEHLKALIIARTLQEP